MSSVWLSAVTVVSLVSSSSSQGGERCGGPAISRQGPITIASTQPVLVPCGGWYTSCFRVTFNITSTAGNPIRIGRIPSQNRLRGRAISAAGVACREVDATGLPQARSWSSGTYSWREEPYPVSAQQPAAMIVEYGCDGRLYYGDELILNAALAVEWRGPDPEPLHFTIRGICPRDPRRANNRHHK